MKEETKVSVFFKHVWQYFKSSIPITLVYFMGGMMMFLAIMRQDPENWGFGDTSLLVWTIISIVMAVGYNALIGYLHGTKGYEMLATGNLKRNTAETYGTVYTISAHNEAKEYRAWKGFAIGGFIAIIPFVVALIFGAKQTTIDEVMAKFIAGAQGSGISVGSGLLIILAMLVSGWSIGPFFVMNATGAGISYYVCTLHAIIPIVLTGVMYIVGAYAGRNKAMKKQAIADAERRAKENREKKINYGGLPSTKPQKRK